MMEFKPPVNEEQPKPLYHTTTKSAAKALEEMVADGDHDINPPSTNHTSHRSGKRSRGGTRRSSDPGSTSNSSASSSSFSMLSSLSGFGPTQGKGKGKEKASYQDQAPLFPADSSPEPQHQGEGTPPYPPIPPFPSTPPVPSKSPPRSKSAHRATHANAKSDSFTSSKKRRGSSSHASRLLDALKYLNLDTDPSTSSPTDSHPHARPSHTTNHTHKRTRSTDSVSTMLHITTERLARETARANEAERQAGEILSHLRSAHEAKMRMERDLTKVREELGMYKTQLDVAQKEIYRAQEIVDRVDRERVQAEDEARKSREKIRKLMAERAMEHAMEEGRRLGFEEGLKHGRASLQLDADEDARKKERSQARSRSALRDILSPEETPRSRRRERSASVSHSSGGDSARRSSSARHARSQSQARPAQGLLPDSRKSGPPEPLNTGPTRASSTQPQPQQGARRPSVSASSAPSAPEDIAIQRHDSSTPTHTIPPRNYSPSATHPPVARPPDNYIPFLGADATIHLPPPHDLSSPPPITPASAVPPPPILHLVGQRPASRAAESSAMAERRDRADAKRQYPPPSRGAASRAAKPRSTMSVMSAGSTRLSSLDLLSPPDEPGPSAPRNYANPMNRGRAYPEIDPDSPTMGSLGLRKRRPRASTQPEKMVEQWRSMNRAPERPASPTETISSRRGETVGGSVAYGNPRNQPAVERPTSAEPIIRPASAAATRTPSRRPREIVLAVPMSGPLMNNNAHPTRSLHPPAVDAQISNQPITPPPQYERSPNRLRSVSNATSVPGIEIVTPSSHSQSTLSRGTRVDPVLLTPDSANRAVPLPPSQPQTTYNAAQNSGGGFYGNPKVRSSDLEEQEQITMVLPDNNFPAGFVPLSPIPGMANLNPYPPGFAPMSPKPGNFTYPTSPLLRA